MLKTILLGLAGAFILAVAILLILAAQKPDSFRIQRSIEIKAPPEKIFGLINDFRNWTQWSPYEKLDPALKRSYGGAPSGQGATYAWEGTGKAGAGRMEIAQSVPASQILINLDFIKPFEAHNIAEFALTPKGETTALTWSMQGPSPFMSKVMSTLFDMDKMIGKDFETGLASLKAIAEQP